MLINGILCKKCDQIIYSRARHDYRTCMCGTVAIDGGFDYTRIMGDVDDFMHVQFNLEVPRAKLLKDWSGRVDMYGIVHKDKIKYKIIPKEITKKKSKLFYNHF